MSGHQPGSEVIRIAREGHVPLLVVGAGGLGVMVLDALVAADPTVIDRVVFVDDAPGSVGHHVHGIPVDGPLDGLLEQLAEEPGLRVEAVLAVAGYPARRDLWERLEGAALRVTWVSAIHPRAVVSPMARVGHGVVIMPGAVVDPDAVIEDHAFINKVATVGHSCVVGRFAQLAPSATGAGIIGEGVFVGMNASVLRGTRVGAGSIVGAAAVVTRDVPEHTTVVGQPARPLQRSGS